MPTLMLHTTAAANAMQHNLDVAGWSPAWSADGTKLAFLAETAGVPQLYLLATGDQTPIQVTNSAAPKSMPIWSADGSKVAFLAGPLAQQVLQLLSSYSLLWGRGTPAFKGQDQQIAAVNALMRKQHGQNTVGAVQRFAWSPDGSKLLFDFYQAAEVHILQVNASGEIAEVAANSWSPTWSPTGKEIAAVSVNGLFRLALADNERYYLSRRLAYVPAWSPDGSRIAFLVDNQLENSQNENDQNNQHPMPRGLADSRQSRALWVIDATGDHEIFLAEDCLNFAWSPDGQRLAYVTGGAHDPDAEVASETTVDPQTALGLYYLWTVVPGSLPVLLAEINSPDIAWKPSP